MTAKDEILPLFFTYTAPSLLAVAERQRAADLIILERDYVDRERVNALVEATIAFLGKLAECEKALAGIYGLAFLHDGNYGGPNYKDELKALEVALAQLKEKL